MPIKAWVAPQLETSRNRESFALVKKCAKKGDLIQVPWCSLKECRIAALRRRIASGLLRQFALHDLIFPLVHQGPIDGTRAEVGHVQIGVNPGNRFVEKRVVFAEDRAVAG